MKAVVCVRVSPRPQDRVKYSPEIQEAKCRNWCEANGHEVVGVIRDILVSGGAATRFDSIFRELDAQAVDLFVVGDLSRWTRDEPEMFWFIKKILSDRGVRLASVDEPWLDSEMPFSATVTTAKVEANYQERLVLKRKTSEGVRKAWAAGKVMGKARFGWSRTDAGWEQDVPRILEFYACWNSGMAIHQMSRQFGLAPAAVRQAISSTAQRRIVGDEIWLRAQARPKGVRATPVRATRANFFRGMLPCPFCGHPMIHQNYWLNYVCLRRYHNHVPHGWTGLSARQYVIPEVQRTLSGLLMPADEHVLAEGLQQPTQITRPRDFTGERDRLTMAWVKGNLSQDRYDKALEDLNAAEMAAAVPPAPPEERFEILRQLSQIVDWEDRDPEAGELVNRLLREVLSIEVHEDRTVSVTVSPDYAEWRSPVHLIA